MRDGAPDPRPQLAAALDQIKCQIDEISSADLGKPTPCAEFDVRTLLAHLVAVLRKLAVVRNDGVMADVPDPAVDVAGDETGAFRRARAELERLWASASDAELDVDRTLAWGTMTGRDVLDAYAHEFTVHAWDLSRVTGRGDALDPVLAESALDWYSRNVPADGRGAGGPFGPVVPVADDADPATRLAAFVGRAV